MDQNTERFIYADDLCVTSQESTFEAVEEHVRNTKLKVNSQNNILRKPTNSKWGATAQTLRSTALALCYSSAEYACPVWERSSHAKKLDPALNNTCRSITGCLKPTNINNLHLLAGIAPADVRRRAASRVEMTKATSDERHLLYGRVPPAQRLKSKRSFLSHVQPLIASQEETRLQLWTKRLEDDPPPIDMGIPPSEALPWA
ncbi:hypothetical protein ABVT39_013997 [Epinephelus coioides]